MFFNSFLFFRLFAERNKTRSGLSQKNANLTHKGDWILLGGLQDSLPGSLTEVKEKRILFTRNLMRLMDKKCVLEGAREMIKGAFWRAVALT
jgi:hypothetical protein